MFGMGAKVDVEFDPGETGEPILTATLEPSNGSGNGDYGRNGGTNGSDLGAMAPMLPPEDRPVGMPGAMNPPPTPIEMLLGNIDSVSPERKEVFNVSQNVYTFHDASAVCAANDANLATYEQVRHAHENGADWCNYGWIKGQMAVYPTQKSTYEKLQKGDPEYRNACGKPGVNGGYFDNPELRFGVNCYGIKPAKKASDELMESQVALPPSPDEIEFEKRVRKFREQMDNAVILPFRKGQWTE